MKPKIILCLVLVLSGGLVGGSQQHQAFPLVEDIRACYTSRSNEWNGRCFRDIIPPPQVKHILLLDDADFRNPFLHKPSAQEIQNYYNQLFNHLERSNQKTCAPYLADNESIRVQFVVITSSGNVLHVQALSGMGPGGVLGVLISGHGIEARINIEDFQRSSMTNQPAVAAKQPLVMVETDYLLNQN